MITGWCKLKVLARVETPGWRHYSNVFLSNDFISVLLGLIDFSDIVMLRSGSNSHCQQNLKCFDMPLLSLSLFS